MTAVDHEALVAMLDRLKLTAIRDGLDSLLDEAARGELTLRESLALLCEREIARKDSRRIEMAIGLARFPYARDLAGFDPALFMPTGSLPHILRSNTRVSLLLQGMNQNGHSIGCVGGVSPRG